MTQDQIEEALRRSLSNFTSPTIGRAGSIHDGQQGYILYDDHVVYIVRDLFAALTAPPVAHGAISDAMVEAFISAFNDAAYRHAQTRLNPITADRAQVREALAVLAAALAPAPAQQSESARTYKDGLRDGYEFGWRCGRYFAVR